MHLVFRMSVADTRVYLRLLGVIAIVAALWALSLVLAREWVKGDLPARGFRPILVRWRPFTLWPLWGPAFRVLYAHPPGCIHEAQCGFPNWRRRVVWRKDEVVNVA